MDVTQKQRLLAADQELLKQANLFFRQIQAIADLSQWRNQEGVTPEHWWWYLDVLARLPEGATVSSVA
jgi:hypothetical protein